MAQPIRGDYRAFEINAVPGLSGGPSFLDAAARLVKMGLSGSTSPADAALLYATAIRETYELRLTTLGHHASPAAGCTSHLSVVDANGSMVSLTNTLLSRFGSKVVLPEAGILMNNGIMWFDPRPGQPNSIAAGAKPLANMCPIILRKDGVPVLAIGAAGGRTIFPTVLQIISYIADFGLSLEEAFQRPRIDASTACHQGQLACRPCRSQPCWSAVPGRDGRGHSLPSQLRYSIGGDAVGFRKHRHGAPLEPVGGGCRGRS